MKFSYKALQSDGAVASGIVEAPNEDAVLAFLARKELRPITVTEEQQSIFSKPLQLGGNITVTDKVFLTKYLALMLKTGTDLFRALDILIIDFQKPAMKHFLMEVRSSLERGQPFYTTFAKYPRQFEPVFVNLVKAGEISGNLEQTFENLSVVLQKEEDMRRRIRAALAYPIILFIVSSLILIFLVTFALPRIADVFLQGDLKPPFFSFAVFTVSQFIARHIYALLTIFFGGSGALYYFLFRTRVGRKYVLRILGHTPFIKQVIERISIQRLASTLGHLMRAGMPILDALELTATAVGNERLERGLQHIAREGVARGLTLGEAFRRESALPLVVTTLIAVSEKAGHLDEVLFTLSTFYESEIDSAIKTLISIIEPCMLIIIGGIVGLIALSVIVPIYQLVGQF